MKKVYYFAYGSNLLHERLIKRVGYAPKYKKYRLYGWKLVFDTSCYFFKGFGDTYANIVKGTEEEYVDGVLYELTAKQFTLLDSVEALYTRELFLTEDNEICAVYINFEEHNKYFADKPTLGYLDIIIQGAKEHELFDLEGTLQIYKREKYPQVKRKKV